MTAAELREKIRALALQVVGEKSKADAAAEAYDDSLIGECKSTKTL